jgi:anhydro-N-acetylmuramic acid kinase
MEKQASYAPIAAIGLMSGTSKDGVDVVRMVTDGDGVMQDIRHYAHPYPRPLYDRLRAAGISDIPLADVLRLEAAVTRQYAQAVFDSGFLDPQVRVVGCHGQTIRHLPHEGLTWQLGDASLLADMLSMHIGRDIPVVADFRRRDLAAGGEGAPLIPLFHARIVGAAGAAFPCAVLNVGGVANVSLLGGPEDSAIAATDCGPGMGLLDQWVQARTGAAYDTDGSLALQGTADPQIVGRALAELPFFTRPLPRSADRYEFNAVLDWLKPSTTADGAATLAMLTTQCIGLTLRGMGAEAATLGALYIGGGGLRNRAVAEGLRAERWNLRDIDTLGWHPLALEAGCFAWLAVRRLRGLPFTTPATTGCARPTVGGLVTWGA